MSMFDTDHFSPIQAGRENLSGSISCVGGAPYWEPGDLLDELVFRIGGFELQVHRVIFEAQSIESSGGLVSATMNWYAHPGWDEDWPGRLRHVAQERGSPRVPAPGGDGMPIEEPRDWSRFDEI
jgi:hypothetical protein